eukprot:TRINITY_DN8279_c0_g1_i1.p1 TRINITY_DN8279_c0_g1~~TRINITY_DN8279_c0_g1_i1.p1  ORF type:complete len:703 (+),score=64.93 TRINITY_DN8279_c0_g1_i1:48-2156(+)
MDSANFAEVVPGPSNADLAESASQAIPLEDLNMIVVGRGPIAEDIVWRRRLVGGRVCWLWTERLPSDAGAQQFDCERPSTPGRWADRVSKSAERAAEYTWDTSTFVWKPPHRRSRASLSGLEKQTVESLQKRHSTSWTTWWSTEPDIIALRANEEYRLVVSSEGFAPGIQVVDTSNPRLDVVWELSGKVVLVGSKFNIPAHPMIINIPTVESADKLQVDVANEEAKPFVTVKRSHALAWGAVSFIQFVMFFMFMDGYEPQMQPGDLPWWRASYTALTIPPFGFSSFPDIFSLCLMGRPLERRFAWLTSVACTFAHYIVSISPVGWIGVHWRTWTLYSVTCLTFVLYMGASLAVFVCTRRQTWTEMLTSIVQSRSLSHAWWFAWTVVGTFGTWIVLYGVALLYVVLSHWNTVIASIFLAAATALVESGTLVATVWIYGRLVYSPRMSTSLKSKLKCMLGDQKQILVLAPSMTHSYAESTRLVSMLVTAVKYPSWQFLFPLLTCFLFNVLLRSTMFIEILSCIVPKSWWFLFAPDAGTTTLNEVRLLFGYPRFVSLIALAASNFIMHGLKDWPLFNMHATLLVLVAAVLEVLEDLIVCSDWLDRTSWRQKTRAFYRGMHPLSLSQAVAVDRDGVRHDRPAIGFSGMRFLPFRCVVVLIAPSCLFAYNLLTLLLGAGFVHNVCTSWISEDDRLLDGLIWQTPLLC